MNYTVYFPKSHQNDATIYYVEILKDAFSSNDVLVSQVEKIVDIPREDVVIIVWAKDALLIKCHNPRQKIICWYQGIVPEEILKTMKNATKYLRCLIWNFYEFLSLRICSYSFFVSERMYEHYKRKYKVDMRDNYYIMPCFNQEIQQINFYVDGKYTIPRFLYAGTMSKWQCVDEMLVLFHKIETIIPEAELYIYTKEQDEANELVLKYNVKHVHIEYVPFRQLNEEIKKFKYGFIIREDIEINKVATPTKMNTYLANGIIPIYTNCIDSFKQNLENLKYRIVISNYDNCLKQITEFEKMTILPEQVYDDYQKNAFSSYYSKNYHIKMIRKAIEETII